MALSWATFVLALAGWLAITAVIWTVLYTAAKRRIGPVYRTDRDAHRDDAEETGDSPA